MSIEYAISRIKQIMLSGAREQTKRLHPGTPRCTALLRSSGLTARLLLFGDGIAGDHRLPPIRLRFYDLRFGGATSLTCGMVLVVMNRSREVADDLLSRVRA